MRELQGQAVGGGRRRARARYRSASSTARWSGSPAGWAPTARAISGSALSITEAPAVAASGAVRAVGQPDRLVHVPYLGHDHSDFSRGGDNGNCGGQYGTAGTAPGGGARNTMKVHGGSQWLPSTADGAPSTSYEACKAFSRTAASAGWSITPATRRINNRSSGRGLRPRRSRSRRRDGDNWGEHWHSMRRQPGGGTATQGFAGRAGEA